MAHQISGLESFILDLFFFMLLKVKVLAVIGFGILSIVLGLDNAMRWS